MLAFLFSRRRTAPPAADASGDRRVAGPYRGYFMVCTAVPVNEGYAGRAAICGERPNPTVLPMHQVATGGIYQTAERAMQAAEHQARHIIDGLSPNWDPFTRPGVSRG